MESHGADRIADLDELRTRIEREHGFLKSLNGKTLGVSSNAYRTKAYDGGGEENLTFQGTYCNNGGGLDIDTGIFTCPTGGTYMFQFHMPPTTTRRPFCPSVRTVRRLPPSSTRTIRTTTRTP